MAFKRSAVRSRLSPPQNTDFSLKSRCFSNFLTYFQFKFSFGSTLGSTKPVNILPFCRRKDGQNGIHPREDQRKENRIFQVQGLRGTGRRRQASFQVYDLVCRVKFILAACILIMGKGHDVLSNEQLFSKEIENDPENLDAILDGGYSHPALTDSALLGLLLE